jgi:hypothetical protein
MLTSQNNTILSQIERYNLNQDDLDQLELNSNGSNIENPEPEFVIIDLNSQTLLDDQTIDDFNAD